MAAAAGGITTVVEMPISNPPTVDRDSFLLKKDIASRKAVVDFALWGGVIPAIAQDLAQRISELRNLGAVAYKAFMCWSASEFPPVDDGLLYAAMLELAKTDQLLGVHAENETIYWTVRNFSVKGLLPNVLRLSGPGRTLSDCGAI